MTNLVETTRIVEATTLVGVTQSRRSAIFAVAVSPEA
jgi:hypothetical protein